MATLLSRLVSTTDFEATRAVHARRLQPSKQEPHMAGLTWTQPSGHGFWLVGTSSPPHGKFKQSAKETGLADGERWASRSEQWFLIYSGRDHSLGLQGTGCVWLRIGPASDLFTVGYIDFR
ncbi:hypothetical protein MTO96_026869 [Rhipicephalus appendiculatus]